MSLGPAGDGAAGEDWVLTFTAAPSDDGDDREDGPAPAGDRVAVRLTPDALQELHVEARSLAPDARGAGHTVECDLCGESVEARRAVPNDRDRPVHRRCYAKAYGGPKWLTDG